MLLLFLLRDGSISEPRAGKVKTGDADKRIGKAAGTQHRPEEIEVRNKKRKGIGNINDLHDKHEHLRNKPELFHRGAAFLRQDEDKQQRGSGQKPEQIPRAEPEYQAIYPNYPCILPRKQEKTSLVLVNKRGFFYGRVSQF